MIKAIHFGLLAEFGSTELAQLNNATLAAEGEQFYCTLIDGVKTWSVGASVPAGASSADHPDYAPDKVPDGRGGWAEAPVAALTELVITTNRLKNELLGLEVYGGLRVARIGLQAKFSAGTATAADVRYLTLLEAADGMTSAVSIDLLDPAVVLVLDFAVANPYIGYSTAAGFVKFDAAHKARVLRNEVLSN